MGLFYLLQKGEELTHTYSSNKRKKLEAEGWKYVAMITGWNVGISYQRSQNERYRI